MKHEPDQSEHLEQFLGVSFCEKKPTVIEARQGSLQSTRSWYFLSFVMASSSDLWINQDLYLVLQSFRWKFKISMDETTSYSALYLYPMGGVPPPIPPCLSLNGGLPPPIPPAFCWICVDVRLMNNILYSVIIQFL